MKTFHIQALKTEFMLSALNCRGATESTFRDKYGAWVQKFSPDLASYGKLVIAHFNARYGGSGPTQLNAFVTRLANIISLGAHGNPNFCLDALNRLDASMAPTVKTVDDSPKGRDYSAEMGFTACGTKPPTPPVKPPASGATKQ